MYRAIVASLKRLFTSDGNANASGQRGDANGHDRSGIIALLACAYKDGFSITSQ